MASVLAASARQSAEPRSSPVSESDGSRTRLPMPARPSRVRSLSYVSYGSYATDDASVLGCPPLKKLACASAVALCLPTPDPIH